MRALACRSPLYCSIVFAEGMHLGRLQHVDHAMCCTRCSQWMRDAEQRDEHILGQRHRRDRREAMGRVFEAHRRISEASSSSERPFLPRLDSVRTKIASTMLLLASSPHILDVFSLAVNLGAEPSPLLAVLAGIHGQWLTRSFTVCVCLRLVCLAPWL
jgi:hypothetical protein